MKKEIISFALAISTLCNTIPTIYAEQNEAETSQPVVFSVASASTYTNKFQKLTDKQRDTLSMLNYLTMLTQQINSSSNSRLYLENAYSEIINNTSPDAVDKRTLGELNTILDTLESYRMTAVKRERLEYIYEQNKANAVRQAIPDPIALLSTTQSYDLKGIVLSFAYMAVDSVTSYQSASSEADLQYLKDNWELDDEEAQNLHNQRKSLFNYMIQTCNENEIPGELALTEEKVEKFTEWEQNTNIPSRIRSLKSAEEEYAVFGGYWLLLADSYFRNGDYEECLDAITKYENLDVKIFRNDYDYAEILPECVIAASEVYSNGTYVAKAEKYVEAILDNTSAEQWSLRYFAAQAYVDFYSKTKKSEFLSKAYEIVYDNVNTLIPEQISQNETYLAAISEVKPEKDATKEEKNEIKQYNKMLNAERKTELPPVYEPLYLNCELLFALADELNISDKEKEEIDSILHPNGEKLFLIEDIDKSFCFNKESAGEWEIVFDGKTLQIPAKDIASDAQIIVTVDNQGEQIVLDDWTLDNVKRKTEGNIDTFTANFSSKSAKKVKYAVGANITIEIIPHAEMASKLFTYTIENVERWFIIPDGKTFQKG